MIETALGNMDNNKILTDVTTTLIKDAISTGWDRVKKFFKDLDAQHQPRIYPKARGGDGIARGGDRRP